MYSAEKETLNLPCSLVVDIKEIPFPGFEIHVKNEAVSML